jgi:hypothetical protein
MSNRISITVTAPMSEPVTTRHRTVTGAARRLAYLDREADDVHAAWGRGVYCVAVEVDGRHVPDDELDTCDGNYATVLSAKMREAA